MNILTLYEVGGLSVTVAIAIVTYFKTQGSAKRLNAAFVSILGTVLTMLVSLRFGVMPEIQTHLTLAQKINKSPRILRLVDGIADAGRIADGAGHPLMVHALRIRLDELEDYLSEVQDGGFSVKPSEMPDFSMKLIEQAQKSYLATSYVSKEEWWDTPWGKIYGRKNFEAVERGVRVERTFIVSSDEDLELLRPLLDRQKKAGILVRVAYVDDLDVKVTSDMLVIDGGFGGELELTPDKGMSRARFSTDEREIDALERRISSLSRQAEIYEPATETSG